MGAIPVDEGRVCDVLIEEVVVFFVTPVNLEPAPDTNRSADWVCGRPGTDDSLWTVPEHVFDQAPTRRARTAGCDSAARTSIGRASAPASALRVP